jgi:cytochrome c oxidase cbb3-type subunit 2
MNSKNFWKLLGALGLSFALPWLLLVVLPYVGQSKAVPVAYAEGEEVEGGVAAYPDRNLQRVGAGDYGRKVYAAEGCAYCHTQVIRPTYAGADRWRPGWGGREGEQGDFARETQPGDYANEAVAPLGYQRIGQDLSNVAYRITTAEEMHRHLFEPKSFNAETGMPAFKHLYHGSADRPKSQAIALVDYLLSLKKDQPLPKSYLSGN